ncbi:IMPACT family protein [Salinarchaeum sp. IM2453]|uniref:IMPACT family protein n=1 Tax=Salinarchaeum sp. IM2453 TaxID=2862870 RepID=UPI001C8350F8|nr:YigZ family protein [Salinarchaeum sp. IM2453]QZA89315.1 IMPACT family protein [Salinarchaeum sp. IM2453]
MTDSYRTITSQGQASFEIQGSEFIGYVAPVQSIDAAESFISAIRGQHPDATHNVPAYRVREGDFLREYENDDNEPSGSAGQPIMNVLQGENLENVAAVVTRYYGGTNLGIGGLVSAYSRAAAEAIETADIITQRPQQRFDVQVTYDDSGTVRGILESSQAEFTAQYEEDVVFSIQIDEDATISLKDRIQSATSGRAQITE